MNVCHQASGIDFFAGVISEEIQCLDEGIPIFLEIAMPIDIKFRWLIEWIVNFVDIQQKNYFFESVAIKRVDNLLMVGFVADTDHHECVRFDFRRRIVVVEGISRETLNDISFP